MLLPGRQSTAANTATNASYFDNSPISSCPPCDQRLFLSASSPQLSLARQAPRMKGHRLVFRTCLKGDFSLIVFVVSYRIRGCASAIYLIYCLSLTQPFVGPVQQYRSFPSVVIALSLKFPALYDLQSCTNLLITVICVVFDVSV